MKNALVGRTNFYLSMTLIERDIPKSSDVHRFRIKINFLLLGLRVKYCFDGDIYLVGFAFENLIYSLYNLFVCI